MGKGEQNLHQQQSHGGENSSELICPGCSMPQFRHTSDWKSQLWTLFHTSEDLEYDINGEIVSQVAILSMHQNDAYNWTDVVFGVLSDPINAPMIPVSLSVLRSSFVELFLKQTNLTLWKQKTPKRMYFANYKQIGSTTDAPVVVQASLMSEFGALPQRLKQLAQTITGSPAKNLALITQSFKVHLLQPPLLLLPLHLQSQQFLHYPASPVHSPAPSPDSNHLPPAPSKYPHILVHVHTTVLEFLQAPHQLLILTLLFLLLMHLMFPLLAFYESLISMSPHVSPAPVVSNAPSPGNKGSAQDLISPSPSRSL
ncbi:hypothetical protein Prudu_004838, partial [Prunus dulcis]